MHATHAASTAPPVEERAAPQATLQPSPAPPERADLFAAAALERAIAKPVIDPGGHLRRATDPPPDRDAETLEREEVTKRVREMVNGELAKDRAESGKVAPRWRDIERKLAQTFHPPLDVVKQENVAKAFAHQVLRSWLDGPPHVGPAPRGLDTSVQTLPGTPEGLNLRSLPMEQALAVQARWGEPATSLRVEVELILDEEGHIVSARVLHPSGRRAFDRTALTAVEEAVRAGGAPEEKRPVLTRWAVEAAVAVAPPTAIGFRFDETGRLNPGATGIRKYVGGTYPFQQTVRTHVSLIAIEPR
jgi:TonB family protein